MTLTDDEVHQFWTDCRKTGPSAKADSNIRLSDIEATLNKINDELTPNPKRHHLSHPKRHQDLHDFIASLFPNCSGTLTEAEFKVQVRRWNIPSFSESGDKDDSDTSYEKNISFPRRVRAHWSVHGPHLLFLLFVGICILAFSLWQGLIYATNAEARSALGWGVILAKFAAGALYPTLLFMLLSMSRHLANLVRRNYFLSRFINWDLSQKFHIVISCLGFVLASLHAIGHLTGTFIFGSRRQTNVESYLETGPLSYGDFVRSRPGWTGLSAYSCYLLIVICSTPYFRKMSYEAFQVAHLLMFPMIAFLCAHGTAKLLQAPMLGYWLAFPALWVLVERGLRLWRGVRPLDATLECLDDDTLAVTIEGPNSRQWHYCAGQYILLQIPQVSFFQWHPFTVSACVGNKLQVHIKLEGTWTNQLRKLYDDLVVRQGEQEDGVHIKAGCDGPFGAPAQRFHRFKRAIVIGSGIGITPFSAILNDLEVNNQAQGDPYKVLHPRSARRLLRRTLSSRSSTSRTATLTDGAAARPEKSSLEKDKTEARAPAERRCDFHWVVKDKNYLLWFSDLLNRAYEMQDHDFMDLNLHTYITAKRKSISARIFRVLLDDFRTEDQPVSALTGLRFPSSFGRPDLSGILSKFDEEMRQEQWAGDVGVFFCGHPAMAREVADGCSMLTAKARNEGRLLKYTFMNEVFG